MRHIVICDPSGSALFFHCISETAQLTKKIMKHKLRVLIFPTTFVCHVSHCKKNWARYYQISISVFMYSNSCSCKILINVEFSRLVFKKYSNTTCHENPFSGSWVVPYGRTDGRTDRYYGVNSCFSQFRESPRKFNICLVEYTLLLLYKNHPLFSRKERDWCWFWKSWKTHAKTPRKKIQNYLMLNYVAPSVTSILGMVTFNKDSCN